MRYLYIFLFSITALILSSLTTQAQNIACPEVVWTTPNPFRLGCDTSETCFTLQATLPDIRQTVDANDAYVVNDIDFNGNFTFDLQNTTPVLVNQDDFFSEVIPLTFPFCFYGKTYHSIVIGANGRISFDSTLANQIDYYTVKNDSLPGVQPANLKGHTRASIYGLYHDMDPGLEPNSPTKSINWKIIDEAPCRKMIISYRDIPLYGGGLGNQCLEKRSTFQIVLYENTNAIEVYIDKKAYCPYSLFKDHIIGIQNWAGNKATTVPGFNPAVGPSSEITQKAYRFVPNGPSLLSGNIELLDENNNVIQSVPNPGGG